MTELTEKHCYFSDLHKNIRKISESEESKNGLYSCNLKHRTEQPIILQVCLSMLIRLQWDHLHYVVI